MVFLVVWEERLKSLHRLTTATYRPKATILREGRSQAMRHLPAVAGMFLGLVGPSDDSYKLPFTQVLTSRLVALWPAALWSFGVVPLL